VRGKTYLICIVLLVVLILLNLPMPVSMYMKTGSRGNLAPFQNIMSFLLRKIPRTMASFVDSRKALGEKQKMMEEIANLRHDIQSLKELETDNADLRKQLGFKSAAKQKLVLCEVVARGDASGWWQTITVNRGGEDGIRQSMAVVTTDGLIGRTTEVARRTCDILLITDPNCKVGCKLVRTGTYGIVRGRGVAPIGITKLEMFAVAPQACSMDYISKDHPVLQGDEVVTSGLGGTYPAGLPVGRVAAAKIDPSRLFQQADIVPAAQLNALKYVFVVVE
jgi:rod shape-determining protein MreC